MRWTTRMRQHWSRLEPGSKELRALREEGDLVTLGMYLEEPDATPGLRRRAAVFTASMAPGGGDAGRFDGATDAAIIPVLTAQFEENEDVEVRRIAAFGLSRTRDPAAAGTLLRALASDDHATQVHGVLGLGRLRWRPAVKPLSRLLDDPNCRRSAAEALVKIGDERAIRPLWAAALAAESPRERKRLEGAAAQLEAAAGLRQL